jgi:hypothetical protein
MWSLKAEGGKRNTATSMWDIKNSKLNNSNETSKQSNQARMPNWE